ncbi:hypothetical protein DL96DRAFT_1675016 [Flagelloscypha sp. PMI_526]|nr:hypothetical protein DL96DRAFT_1675016 [Flagelloscypha sp. PMI_526]
MASFDPGAGLADVLQRRLDSWQTSPPSSQFQAYGPLNMYLTHKYPPSRFLVKPQSLLRATRESDMADMTDDPEEDNDDVTSNDSNESLYSIDSRGVAVLKKHARYPDFSVDRNYGDPNLDEIAVIVEVASMLRIEGETQAFIDEFKDTVRYQLRKYLRRAAWRDSDLVDRCGGHPVLGIGVLGNEVCMLRAYPKTIERQPAAGQPRIVMLKFGSDWYDTIPLTLHITLALRHAGCKADCITERIRRISVEMLEAVSCQEKMAMGA